MTDIVVSDKLTIRERVAYEDYVQKGLPSIAPATQAQFLALFLRGKGCEEIHSLNSSFPLGAIVKARVDGDWDRRLEDYRETLLTGVQEKITQIEFESIGFLTDLLAAAHKQQGDKLKKYLQSGDPSQLGDLQITSIKNYKEVLELLMKATGQEKTQVVHHKIDGAPTIDVSKLSSASSDQATEILKLLGEKK